MEEKGFAFRDGLGEAENGLVLVDAWFLEVDLNIDSPRSVGSWDALKASVCGADDLCCDESLGVETDILVPRMALIVPGLFRHGLFLQVKM